MLVHPPEEAAEVRHPRRHVLSPAVVVGAAALELCAFTLAAKTMAEHTAISFVLTNIVENGGCEGKK